MIAKDIMTRDVITVTPEERVEKVVALLVDNKISGIPVVDADRTVDGESVRGYGATAFRNEDTDFVEAFNNELKKYTASRVKDAMTKKVLVVEEDTPVNEIVTILQNKKVNRVPVVRNGKLVGIITRNDILKSLVKSNG